MVGSKCLGDEMNTYKIAVSPTHQNIISVQIPLQFLGNDHLTTKVSLDRRYPLPDSVTFIIIAGWECHDVLLRKWWVSIKEGNDIEKLCTAGIMDNVQWLENVYLEVLIYIILVGQWTNSPWTKQSQFTVQFFSKILQHSKTEKAVLSHLSTTLKGSGFCG